MFQESPVSQTPDSSMTYEDIILRVSEALGLCAYAEEADDNRAVIPTDPHDLDLVKRAIRDGLGLMQRASPKWRCLQPVLEVTLAPLGDGAASIDGDPARIRLPWWVTGEPSRWTWEQEDSGGYGGDLVVTSEHRILAAHASSSTSGRPQLIALTPRRNGRTVGDPILGYEAHIYPDPDQAYILRARCRVHPSPLVELNDRHVFGAQHDQTIIAASVYSAMRWDRTRAEDTELWRKRWLEAKAESIALDLENVPGSLGCLEEPISEGRIPAAEGYLGVQTHNGVAIN
jgi:hypothetical protein